MKKCAFSNAIKTNCTLNNCLKGNKFLLGILYLIYLKITYRIVIITCNLAQSRHI